MIYSQIIQSKTVAYIRNLPTDLLTYGLTFCHYSTIAYTSGVFAHAAWTLRLCDVRYPPIAARTHCHYVDIVIGEYRGAQKCLL